MSLSGSCSVPLSTAFRQDKLEQMHMKHVDILLQVQLEGKKQQKREYELKLPQKMHKIERMQEEYQEL